MQFQMIKPMLPTLVHEIPKNEHWFYEIKYDGYRTILHWDHDDIFLQSRNLNALDKQFPEVVQGLTLLNDHFNDMFPLVFDGELCVLTSNYKADFSTIQRRGRLRAASRIQAAALKNPAKLCVFDLLQVKRENVCSLAFNDRKRKLKEVLLTANIPLDVQVNNNLSIMGIAAGDEPEKLWQLARNSDSEGIIAKRATSIWQSGRTKDWLKIKNNKHGLFIITGFNPANGFFHVSVVRTEHLYPIGVFSHGLEADERDAIIQIIHKNKVDVMNGIILVEPRICVELEFLELYKEQLRQPRFVRFRFDQIWEACTWEALQNHKEN